MRAPDPEITKPASSGVRVLIGCGIALGTLCLVFTFIVGICVLKH